MSTACRIAGPIRLTRGDSITLGRTVSFPWPPELTDDPSESAVWLTTTSCSTTRESRAIMPVCSSSPVSQTLIEDIGSSNGTFLNSADRRVTGPTRINESDTLYFGTLAMPAARLLSAPVNAETPAPSQFPSTLNVETTSAQNAASAGVLAELHSNRWYLAWIGQVLIFAVVIVLTVHRPRGAAAANANAPGVAATAFGLALAAIWLGCSLAILESAAGHPVVARRQTPRWPGSCSVPRCARALLTIVYWGSGLKGPWLAMWGMLTMSSLVGLCSGLVIAVILRNWAAAASVLLLGFVVMIAFGGWLRPLPAMTSPLRLVAAAMPSRWTFEGLLLLETDQHRAPAFAESSGDQDHDLAEPFFPAGSNEWAPRPTRSPWPQC